MARRKLNALERKLHQAALTKPENIISQQEIDNFAPSAKERLSAINFLLGTGLFVVLSGKGSRLLYKALTQDVIEVKKGLTEEETLVLDRIRAAGTQGLWTKHIKTQTQLHQSVVDKCLKTLTQKQLIKTVTDVRHATRKIYMLAHLEPAVELTGGPWFTDKELDTEFIKLLSDVCLKVVRDRSFPKAIHSGVKRLFPLSYSSYPTANQILGALKKSRVTETELTVQHIEMLLEVLVFDGQVEKIPAFHVSEHGDQDSDTEEHPLPASQRSYRHEGRDDSDPELNRSRRRRRSEIAPDSDDMSSTSDGHCTSRKRRRRESKIRTGRTRDASSSRNLKDYDDYDSGTETEPYGRSRRRSRVDSDDDVDTSEDDRPRRKRRRSHRSRHVADDSPDRRKGKGRMQDVSSSSEGTDDEQPRRRIDNRPEPQFDIFAAIAPASRFVYRAIHDEKVSLGLNQSPCVVCPVFDFCRDGGPVNSQECMYYEPWLSAGSELVG